MQGELTKKQRTAFLDGKSPNLDAAIDSPPTFAIGTVIQIAPQFEIEIQSIKLRKQKWRVEYLIRDDRPRLLSKRSPRSESGKSKRHWRPDEEHGYTTQPGLGIEDAGEAVDDAYQNKLVAEAEHNWEKYQEMTNPGQQARKRAKMLTNRLRKTISAKIKDGVDITPELTAAIEAMETKPKEAQMDPEDFVTNENQKDLVAIEPQAVCAL